MTVKELIQNVEDLKVHLNEISVYDLDVHTSLDLYYTIAKKFNVVIKELSRFEGVVSDEVIKQNEKLVYLLGEGLTTEVVNKINNMIKDGTIDKIINTNLFNDLKSQIKEKANLNEVFTKDKGININDFDEETRQTFLNSQGIDVNYILGEKNVKNENLDLNCVNYENLNDMEGVKNINSLFTNNVLLNYREEKFSIVRDESSTATQSGIVSDGYTYDMLTLNDDKIVVNNASTTHWNLIEVIIDKFKTVSCINKGIYIYIKINSRTDTEIQPYLYTVLGDDTYEYVTLSSITLNTGVNEIEIYQKIKDNAKTIRFYLGTKDNKKVDFDITNYNIMCGNNKGIKDTFENKNILVNKLTNKSNKSKWEGKTVNFVGDSITELYGYKNIASDILGCNMVNCGLAGTTMTVNSNSYYADKSIVERVCGLNGNTSYSDADLWVIMGGINDYNNNVPIGAISDTDNTTFYGAYKQVIEYILNRPNKPRIAILTLMQSNGVGVGNALGLQPKNFRNATIEIAEYYSIPCFDTYKNGGLSVYKITDNTLDNDGLHPNTEISKIIGERIANFLETV